MKNNLFKVVLAVDFCLILLSASCTNRVQQPDNVLDTYFQIKDALVETDYNSASSAAEDLLGLLNGKNDDLSLKLKKDASQISKSNDVEFQRKHFNSLSENMYALVKNASGKERTIYQQYCPMAFNNTGAFWLASEKEINNPYFGDKMLHCGMVKEEL